LQSQLTKLVQAAMPSRRAVSQDAAESLAIAALTFIANDPERLGRFLAVTGIGPDRLRAAAREPEFLVGVLDHMLADEALIADFAAHAAIDPADVGQARAVLGGGSWEREVP
jgi:hypothetical protein